MPEAALARELDLGYGTIAVVVNHAAGRGARAHGIRVPDIADVGRRAAIRVCKLLEKLVLVS